jgi:hypothetical protein
VNGFPTVAPGFGVSTSFAVPGTTGTLTGITTGRVVGGVTAAGDALPHGLPAKSTLDSPSVTSMPSAADVIESARCVSVVGVTTCWFRCTVSRPPRSRSTGWLGSGMLRGTSMPSTSSARPATCDDPLGAGTPFWHV